MFQPGPYNQAPGFQNMNNANLIDESSQYPMVTCWFNVNGIDLNEGVRLRSDFTFEEVLEDARQKNIINEMPEKIEVKTKSEEKKVLATLMEMQMFKLTERLGNQSDLELVIHFTQPGFTYQPGQYQQNQLNMMQGGLLKIAQHNFNFPQQPNQQLSNSGALLFPNQSLQNKPAQQQYLLNNFNTANLNVKTQNQQTQILNQVGNNQQNFQNASAPFTPILKNQIPTQAQQQLQVNPQNIVQQQSQQTKMSQIINPQQLGDQTHTPEQKAQQQNEKIVEPGDFTFIVDENGQHIPKLRGYFTEDQGKPQNNINEKEYKWIYKSGVQIALVQEKGFIIKWKNNTYNSLSVTLY